MLERKMESHDRKLKSLDEHRRILGCIALSIYGHRKILDIALGLLVVALAGLIWRNRRTARRSKPYEVDEEGFVLVEGHSAMHSHIRHSGEAD